MPPPDNRFTTAQIAIKIKSSFNTLPAIVMPKDKKTRNTIIFNRVFIISIPPLPISLVHLICLGKNNQNRQELSCLSIERYKDCDTLLK